MQPFSVLTAIAVPLLRESIDTDVIIRIERLVGANRRSELGHWCFEALRYRADGAENPDFVLNRAVFRDAQILIAGANFGCGSSREGAVWALMQMGLRSVIAPSFGDIFFNNCFQNGMLPVTLDAAAVEQIAADVGQDPAANLLTVDLVRQVVVSRRGAEHRFHVPALRRAAMLEGLDELALTLAREVEIAAHHALDRTRRPWIYRTVESSN
jgi:3-isopropylmalate/(R)-2-methylmalate dehydratase small subunit